VADLLVLACASLGVAVLRPARADELEIRDAHALLQSLRRPARRALRRCVIADPLDLLEFVLALAALVDVDGHGITLPTKSIIGRVSHSLPEARIWCRAILPRSSGGMCTSGLFDQCCRSIRSTDRRSPEECPSCTRGSSGALVRAHGSDGATPANQSEACRQSSCPTSTGLTTRAERATCSSRCSRRLNDNRRSRLGGRLSRRHEARANRRVPRHRQMTLFAVLKRIFGV
jgi:hypothetical protein